MGEKTLGEDSKALGRKIQQIRQDTGLTQQQLCQKAELSYSTLAKIERGAIKTPSVFTVYRVAQVLGVSLDDLMGAVVQTPKQQPVASASKKTSKNGIQFVYLDINGCLVRFFHGAFTTLSLETGVPSDVVESAFWHYNDAICRGEMTMQEFNTELGERFGLTDFNWQQHYMQAVEPIAEMQELAAWAAQHYKVGLLSNIMPNFIPDMIENGLLPGIAYDSIVDSSIVGAIKPEDTIYEVAEKQAGVDPSQILFIDDSRTNLMAAEHRGWKVLWFDDYRPQESAERIKKTLAF